MSYSPAVPAERRKAKRYRMSAPVVFRWSGPESKVFKGDGFTRDVSVEGIFILASACPPANAVVQVDVIFPVSEGSSKAQMSADMMVLRVDHEIEGRNRSGFSAAGNGFSLRTFSERASRAVRELIAQSQEPQEPA